MDANLEKKYISLADYFHKAQNESITLTFTQIEQIMGHQLPNAAYLNVSWWKKSKPPVKHFRAWTNAGYSVAEVNPGRDITFVKTDSHKGSEENSTGQEDIILVRPAELDDARPFINMQQTVESESGFMLYGHGERKLSTQHVRKQLGEWKKEGHSTVLIALLNGRQAGYLVFLGTSAKRASHRASLVLGVLPECQGKGVGRSLLQKAEEWAAAKQVTRLELTVVEQNKPARSLYEKTGFVTEGVRKQALFIDGSFHDELYMAKLLQ